MKTKIKQKKEIYYDPCETSREKPKKENCKKLEAFLNKKKGETHKTEINMGFGTVATKTEEKNLKLEH